MNFSLGRTILAVATTVVVVSIVAGIAVVGSPREGRLQQLDSGRIADLRRIMGATDQYWSRNERLPASLEELAEDPRTQVNTIDPGSAQSYEYRALDTDSYELCAYFDRESLEPPGRAVADFWTHGSGRQCFELDVDTGA